MATVPFSQAISTQDTQTIQNVKEIKEQVKIEIELLKNKMAPSRKKLNALYVDFSYFESLYMECG